jgi:TolB-like protein
MTERDTRIRELYEAALKKPIGERPSFVARKAGGDHDLRRRVEALLAGQQDTQISGYEPMTGAILETGTLIGSYRIDGPLGAGGMGVVYRATDTKLNRPAAIKVLPETLADPEARRRFQREAQLVSSLNHPHIVTVYDAGEYQERQYLITEYVDGGTLRQWAARPRGWRPIVELLIGVADGIATAHEAGILHRDIKPENILLAKNGYAKLADFGIAKLLEADPLADDAFGAAKPGDHSSLIGTAAYMSPEQTQGLSLDARSDVYSFGLVLYELLAGTRSFGHRDAQNTALPPLGEEIPADLRTIVAKALEAEPADRYQTMRDLVVDLRRLVRRSDAELGGLFATGNATNARTAPAVPRFADRRLWYFAAGLALLAVLGFATRETFFGEPAATTVVVLPFVNESGAPEDVPISEGLGDDLRDRLMAVPSLSVQARASSISFRDQDADMPTIAATLGVGRLVNGSLRRQGRTLEVVLEVLDDRGFVIQTPLRFQAQETGLQAMQQEIATRVIRLLAPEAVAGAETKTPETPTLASERANLLVIFGTRAERQVKEEFAVDESKLDEAIDSYRQATLADPNSLAAHARLASVLLYNGDVEGAAAPLRKAIDLGAKIEPGSATADLSHAWSTSALFLLATRSETGIEAAYKQAIALNPSNVDALGGYAQWLLVHNRDEAAEYFREAILRDRRSLSRYLDYAEYLGIIEDMQGVRDVGTDILNRFDGARGYLALARIHEITGDLDVGIAWGLRAFSEQPSDDDTRGQVGELYARIGEFETAAAYDPGPHIYQLYYERRYDDLVDLAQEVVLDHPEDLGAKYMLGFAYNAIEYFDQAKHILIGAGLPVMPGAEYTSGGAEMTALLSYVDALQGLDPDDAEARMYAEARTRVALSASSLGLANSWWSNAHGACALAQLGRNEEALVLLDRVKNAQGLVWSPFVQDSPCFKRLAAEPGYVALLDHLEERKRILRERLPETLLEHGVADVRP